MPFSFEGLKVGFGGILTVKVFHGFTDWAIYEGVKTGKVLYGFIDIKHRHC